jgi:hypothetical protein
LDSDNSKKNNSTLSGHSYYGSVSIGIINLSCSKSDYWLIFGLGITPPGGSASGGNQFTSPSLINSNKKK